MRGLKKSKSVSWASDVNLCQVRLFLSDESPSRAGFGAEDHLQAKTSWASHSTGVGSADSFPPGFEGTQPENLLRNKLSQIPLTKWICPPRFTSDLTWQVTAGEESEEVESQSQREMRVLEAVYPRQSAIPMNPSMLANVEHSSNDDQNTSLIPLTPIEDEDEATIASSDSVASSTISVAQAQLFVTGTPTSQCNITINPNSFSNENLETAMARGVAPDALKTAYTALSAATSKIDQGNLIYNDLLFKIFRDPKLIEKLVSSHGAASNSQLIPPSMPSGITISDPAPVPVPVPVQVNRTEIVSSSSTPATSTGPVYPSPTRISSHSAAPNPQVIPLSMPSGITISDPPLVPVQVNRAEIVSSSPTQATSTGPFYPPPTRILPIQDFRPTPRDVVPAPSPPMGGPLAKDINYYKNLIQQHGGEKEALPHYGSRQNHHLGGVPEPVNNFRTGHLRPRIMKPCMYFNSSRGCRNGANCAFQHDTSSLQRGGNIPETQTAKRMKMDREIIGR